MEGAKNFPGRSGNASVQNMVASKVVLLRTAGSFQSVSLVCHRQIALNIEYLRSVFHLDNKVGECAEFVFVLDCMCYRGQALSNYVQ